MRKLFTIGYEKCRQDAVLGELKRAGVKTLVDIRAVAASRRPGFSKTQLAAALDEQGIAYIHLRKLGTPADGRAASRSGDYDTLWRIYDGHLKTPEAVDAMDDLINIVQSGKPVCLLCYERDPTHCHRSRVADIVKKHTKVTVADLVPPQF
jgi:uncharacterized protein (DUF488 family)